MGTMLNYQIQITLFIRLVSKKKRDDVHIPLCQCSLFKIHIKWINIHCVNLIFILTLSFIPVIS